MNYKKIIILAILAIFAMSSLTFAARGSARISSFRSAPSFSSHQKAPSISKTREYKPSQDAKSISKNAPESTNMARSNASTSTGTSRWGNTLRNIGLFGGGMFLGSMLGHMFGMGGTGFFSSMMGLLFNIVMIFAVIAVVRMIWSKLKGSSKQNTSNYQRQSQYSDMMQSRPQEKIVDITPKRAMGNDYDSKTTADEYRRR